MPERSLAIRLQVADDGQVKATLQSIGETGQKALQKITVAATPASNALTALNAAANDVKGKFEEFSGSLGPVGSALSSIGTTGILVGGAIGLIGETLIKSIEAADQAEQSFNRLSGVLKATSNSSGLTAEEIVGLSKSMEATTLTTAEQVQNAATVLATFRSVSGDTFTRALSLSQDLSVVFGRDLSSSAQQLGKALEDPINGLTSLRRIGVVFTESQREMIKTLAETGQTGQAQTIILDALQQKIGGAAAAEDQGLTGAAHSLSISWKNMLETIGQTSVVGGTAEYVLEKIANAAQVTTELLAKDPLETQIAKKKQEIADLQAGLAQLQKDQPNFDSDITPLLDNQKNKIAALKADLQSLNDAVKKQSDDKAAALQSAADAQRDQRAEALQKLVGDLNKSMDKVLTDPDEKIAKINNELAVTKQRIEALREKDNSNAPAISSAINEAQNLAQRQIDAVMKPINEAADKAEQQNQKVLSDLQRQLLGFSDQRQSFIDQAVGRLSDTATKAEVDQTKRLAGSLFDEKAFTDAKKIIDELTRSLEKVGDARKGAVDNAVARLPAGATQAQIDQTKQLAGALYDQTEAEKQKQKLQEEGKKITEETKTAAEGYAQKIDQLNQLLAAGAITQNVYNEALKKINKDSLAASTDGLDGAIRAFQDYGNTGQSAAQAVEKAFTSAMDSTTDAIAGLVTGGSTGLKSLESLANSVVSDITKMVVQKSITGPLFNAIGNSLGGSGGGAGFFGDLFGSIFHEGGVAGDLAPKRRVPAYIFAGAPRYHTGGIAGLQPGEIPAILQRGETVLPKNSGFGAPVSVIMNIQTPDANSFRASSGQLAAQAARNIKQANRNL